LRRALGRGAIGAIGVEGDGLDVEDSAGEAGGKDGLKWTLDGDGLKRTLEGDSA
jgi:hypothetical protein